jgi:predicted phosphoribosyltransferase
MRFKNRKEAGELLGKELNKYLTDEEKQNAVILAIPRGGVPVAYYVSKETGIPFNIVITKKITSPAEPEAALGAVAVDGSYIISDYAKRWYSEEKLLKFKETAYQEALKRAKKYGYKDLDLKGKIVIIIDDGVATGYTAMSAGMLAKKKGASKVIIAVPVCPSDSVYRLKEVFDDVICLYRSNNPFFAVGAFYDDFHQVEDDEFFEYIEKAKKENLLA